MMRIKKEKENKCIFGKKKSDAQSVSREVGFDISPPSERVLQTQHPLCIFLLCYFPILARVKKFYKKCTIVLTLCPASIEKKITQFRHV